MVYNKLVRDGIPEYIRSLGKRAVAHVARPEELGGALDNKLLEEANEVVQATSHASRVNELADLEEVVTAFMRFHGIKSDEVAKAREKKGNERGRFVNGIILEEADD